MAKTVLQVVQDVCGRTGQAAPNALLQSGDAGFIQYVKLLDEVGAEISERHQWQALTKRVTWVAPGTQLQGTIAALFGTNVEYIVAASIYDAADQRIMTGALPIVAIQDIKNLINFGPYPEYWFEEGSLYVNPAPAAGHGMNAYYLSNAWVNRSGGGVANTIANDADTFAFEDELMILGLKYRWLRTKGLSYAEEMDDFEKRLADKAARDVPKPVRYLDCPPRGRYVPNVPGP